MASVNKVIIVGNLGNDPEVRTFDGGGMIATISVATTDRWTDRNTGEPREATEWHRITFNNRLAEIARDYLKKGSAVYVEGSLHTRKWQDPQTGQDRYSTEIRASSMQMLGGRGGQSSEGYQNQASNHNQTPSQNRSRQNPRPELGHNEQGYAGQNYDKPNAFGQPKNSLPAFEAGANDDDMPF